MTLSPNKITLILTLLILSNVAIQGCKSEVAGAKSTSDQSAQQLIKQGKFKEAEVILQKVVDDDPSAGRSWFLLGYVLHAQEKYDEALKVHLKAAEFQQFKPTALYNAACIYSIQEQTELSIKTLQEAVAAGFGNRSSLKNDSDLENVRTDPRFAKLVPPLLRGSDVFVEPTKVIHEVDGEAARSEFGWVARKIGDVDNDGVIDFVSTAPSFDDNSGKIYVYSSKNAELLFTRTGEQGQRYGNGAAGAGDVNNDGTPDLIIGAPLSGNGFAEVLSGKDGTVIHKVSGGQSDGQLGYKVAGIGDVDGDGHDDFVATSYKGGAGLCRGFSGKDGSEIFTLKGERSGDKYGSAVAGNMDSTYNLLAVGAQDAGEGKRGKVYVYRFEKGQPKLHYVINAKSTSKELGQMFISFPGDLDRDGIPDVYCSDFSDTSKGPSTGRVFVYSGKDGDLILDVKGKQSGEGFGTSVSDAGDANGDGIGDLIVGAWQNREGARSGGKVYLISGANGKTLRTWTCKQLGDTFGFDATGIGDVDGDGSIDFLLTSAWSNIIDAQTGRVFIVSGSDVKE